MAHSTMNYSNPPGVKAIVNIPGWVFGGWERGKITKAAQAYDYIPIVRRGVDILAHSLVSIPYHIYRDGSEDSVEQEWPFDADFEQLLSETVKAYLLEGCGYWLKLKNRVKTQGLQWLNPTSMITPKYDGMRDDGTTGIRFTQQATVAGSSETRTWTEAEMVYFRQWHIADDITPGVSVVRNIMDAANLHYYMTRYGKNTFETGAMPIVIMTAEGNPSEEELKRGQGFFQRAMTGVANAMKVLVLRGVWKPQIISPPLNTLAMPELAAYALEQVALGFGIPQTMLTDAANFATAEAHDIQFWRNTVVPLAEFFEHIINTQLLNPMGLRLDFAEKEMDIFQEDESQRSKSLYNLVASSIPLAMSMQILGYDLPNEMTYDEFEVYLLAHPPVMLAGRPGPLAQENVPPVTDVTPRDAAAKSSLQAWQRMALNRAKQGKPLREFETDEIPPALKGAVSGALDAARTPGQIRQVFTNALTWQEYP